MKKICKHFFGMSFNVAVSPSQATSEHDLFSTLVCYNLAKYVISEPNKPKIIQFETKSDHSSSKSVSKIYVLYLRDFL